MISYDKKQSLVKLVCMTMLISRSVFVNSARTLRAVDSNTGPHSSRAKIAEIFENSARNIPSIPLAYVPIPLVPRRYNSSGFFFFEVLTDAVAKFCKLSAM